MRNSKKCLVVKFGTPKKYKLNGLWFGPARPKTAIVFVHGLGGNAFGLQELVVPLADANTVVLTFNNRGHDKISKLYPINQRKRKPVIAGAAHEVFVQCSDDIDGAINFARHSGAKKIYLVGHSTGCQKAVYYASRQGKQKKIAGVILLAPISDYAAALAHEDKKGLARATALARKFVRTRQKHRLLPEDLWPHIDDAQRFLSLNTPESTEEIFSYVDLKKNPRIYKAVHAPMLVLIGEKDEFLDRPADKFLAWFTKNSRSQKFQGCIIRKTRHSFQKKEDEVVRTIRAWLRGEEL